MAQGFIRAVADVFGVLAALLFLFSIGGAYVGIVTLYRILWPRTSRYFRSDPAA